VDGRALSELARRPDVELADVLHHFDRAAPSRLVERVLTSIKYEGYIARQQRDIQRQSKLECEAIPRWMDFDRVAGLRAEAAQALAKFRPATMGQAARLAGVTPADLMLVSVAIRRGPRTEAAAV